MRQWMEKDRLRKKPKKSGRLEAADASCYAKYSNGIVVVSHFAGVSGASLTALNVARELGEGLGIPVVTILLQPGELEGDYGRFGPVFTVPRHLAASHQLDPRRWARVIKHGIYIAESAWLGDEARFWRRISAYLAQRQIRHAVCNTVLSGYAAVRLKSAGVTSVGLVHELPHSIRAYNWTKHAAALVQGVDSLVFACPAVETAFAEAFAVTDKPSFVFPQGFNIDPDRLNGEKRTGLRSALRAQLGLAGEDTLILGSGTGDFRKGIDLFVQAAREMAISSCSGTEKKTVFAWAGPVNWDFRLWVAKDVSQLNLSDRLLFLGLQKDMASCFAAADIFFLTSREDPYPNVVLEAMASGLPVVAFAGTGGVEDQLSGGVGITIPYGDIRSALTALRDLSEQQDKRALLGQLGREKMALTGGFPEYVRRLLDLFGKT